MFFCAARLQLSLLLGVVESSLFDRMTNSDSQIVHYVLQENARRIIHKSLDLKEVF